MSVALVSIAAGMGAFGRNSPQSDGYGELEVNSNDAERAVASSPEVPNENEIDLHRPDPHAFFENVYGCSTVALIRDLHFIAKAGHHWHARVGRILTTFFLLFLCIYLQVFLLAKIKLFVTARAVHDVRLAYDRFEIEMYADSHFTVNGFHRGDGVFHQKHFDAVPEDVKGTVCRIPFTQPEFFFVIVFIWTLTVLGEIKQMRSWWLCLILKTRTRGLYIEDMRYCFDPIKAEGEVSDHTLKIVHSLTLLVKGILVLCIGLPRAGITGYLLWLGCRWLAATSDLTNLIMNAVALEFILVLKDLIYNALVPHRTKADTQLTQMNPEYDHVPVSVFHTMGVIPWVLLAAGWTWLYIFKLETVLPEYGWDVHGACTRWMEKRYALTAFALNATQTGR